MSLNSFLGSDKENYVHNLNNIMKNDDLKEFQMLTKKRGTVNVQCSEGTALCLSVEHQSRTIFDFLMEAPELKIDLNGGYNGDNALLLTVYKNHESRLEERKDTLYMYFMRGLLERGASPNAASLWGYTPFMVACGSGYDDCIRLMLSHGGAVRAGGWSQFRRTLDIVLESKHCSQDTLEAIFHRLAEQQTHTQLHSVTIGLMIKKKHLQLLEKILGCISDVLISSERELHYLLSDLNELPFRVFKEMVGRFPNLLKAIQRAKSLNIVTLANQSPDFVEYLRFMCEKCQNLECFNASWLLEPPTIVPLELLSEVLPMVLRNKVPITIDMHRLYGLYGFTPSFDTLLLSNDVSYVAFRPQRTRTDFAAVHYSITLDTEPPFTSKKKFADSDRYFAGNGQVPSLLELSRDFIRKIVIKRNRIQNHRQYPAVLEKLNLCQFDMEILRFKRGIY